MRYTLLLVFLFLINCTATNPTVLESIDYRANPEINTEMPERSLYWIQTRIVIEVSTFDGDCELKLYAANSESILNEFKIAEQMFDDIGLRFQINQVVFVPVLYDIESIFKDASLYPNYMSVYYPLLSSSFSMVSGVGNLPWNDSSSDGIIVTMLRSKTTLAHEIGHYFGLLHTFEEDYCDDTPEQLFLECIDYDSEEDINVNCRNLMNYCTHDSRFVTKDQLERMKRFLRTSRKSIITEQPGFNLQSLMP